MPTFDLVLLFQKMDKSALKSVLKRNAEYIFEVGGTIRALENLGFRDTPYKINHGGNSYKQCHYFVMKYDGSYEMREKLKKQLKLDRDVLRACNFEVAKHPYLLHTPKEKEECTLYQDLLPPPERPAVIELQNRFKEKQEEKKKREKVPMKNLEDKQYLIF